MTIPRVTKIEHIETIRPNCSSGTGYSEPDIFKFYLDDGNTLTRMIDVWYRPMDVVAQTCKKLCYEELPIGNPSDVFEWLLNYYK